MSTVFSAVTAAALIWALLGQTDPLRFVACKEVSVLLAPKTQKIKAGKRPEFSVVISNGRDRAVRLLDVRDGRRPDLQDSYFELVVVQGGSPVDVPIAISDPGRISPADFLDLRPGAQMAIPRINYTRALGDLRPGQYEAFILFWRDPRQPATTRCRSTSARFAVER